MQSGGLCDCDIRRAVAKKAKQQQHPSSAKSQLCYKGINQHQPLLHLGTSGHSSPKHKDWEYCVEQALLGLVGKEALEMEEAFGDCVILPVSILDGSICAYPFRAEGSSPKALDFIAESGY